MGALEEPMGPLPMCEGKWVIVKWVNVSIVRSKFLGMDALASFHGTGDRMSLDATVPLTVLNKIL